MNLFDPHGGEIAQVESFWYRDQLCLAVMPVVWLLLHGFRLSVTQPMDLISTRGVFVLSGYIVWLP